MNQAVVGAAYAVRGELVIKADQYQRMLADPAQSDKLPFKEIIYCNIGTPSLPPHPIEKKGHLPFCLVC